MVSTGDDFEPVSVRAAIQIESETRKQILAFVERAVLSERIQSVWLTGSRARGNARHDSDWDVVAFTPDAPRGPDALFQYNQISREKIDGGHIELVIAHPDHWTDLSRYMTECRNSGIRLR